MIMQTVLVCHRLPVGPGLIWRGDIGIQGLPDIAEFLLTKRPIRVTYAVPQSPAGRLRRADRGLDSPTPRGLQLFAEHGLMAPRPHSEAA